MLKYLSFDIVTSLISSSNFLSDNDYYLNCIDHLHLGGSKFDSDPELKTVHSRRTEMDTSSYYE